MTGSVRVNAKKDHIKAVLDYVQNQRQQHGLDGLGPEAVLTQTVLTAGLEQHWQTPAAQESQERIREIVNQLVRDWDSVEQQIQLDYDTTSEDE